MNLCKLIPRPLTDRATTLFGCAVGGAVVGAFVVATLGGRTRDGGLLNDGVLRKDCHIFGTVFVLKALAVQGAGVVIKPQGIDHFVRATGGAGSLLHP